MPRWYGPKRRVFISFFGDNADDALEYVRWAESWDVMIPRMLHETYNGDFVDSSNPEYVTNVIRRD